MPELPEVETIRRGLARLIIGRTVSHTICYDSPKSFPNQPDQVAQFLHGTAVMAVRRRAKVLIVDLSSKYSLVIHLKMTGQLIFLKSKIQNLKSDRWGGGHPNDSLVNRLPDNSTRVEIAFTDNSTLFFNDQRKFGWVRLYPTLEVPNIDFMKRVGPEPLEDGFTGDVLYERLQRRKNTSIKAALLDQSVVAGIGNIYADESLWAAQIHPATLVRNVPKSIIQTLTSEIKAVLLLSIQKGGSTDRNYIDAEGKKGSYLKFARVFRREGLECPRCASTIEKIRVAGRGTHVCDVCQVLH